MTHFIILNDSEIERNMTMTQKVFHLSNRLVLIQKKMLMFVFNYPND